MNRSSLLVLAFLSGACSESTAPQPPETPLASAEAPSAPRIAALPPIEDAPPTVNGLYIAKDACPGEGCYLVGRIKAYESADLFDRAGSGAAVVGRIEAGEWVEIVRREEHLAPVRGVVREGRKHFATGDVVFLLTSQGEGCYDIWSNGVIASWCDPEAVGDPAVDEVIDFDAAWAPDPEGAGLWIQIKRDTGSEGWLRGADKFGCTGYQDRDPDCPPLPQ